MLYRWFASSSYLVSVTRFVKFLPPDEVRHDPVLQGLFQRVVG